MSSPKNHWTLRLTPVFFLPKNPDPSLQWLFWGPKNTPFFAGSNPSIRGSLGILRVDKKRPRKKTEDWKQYNGVYLKKNEYILWAGLIQTLHLDPNVGLQYNLYQSFGHT